MSASTHETSFPNDETGQVLTEMAAAGIDLNKQHAVVFFQLFENEADAKAMAAHLAQEQPDLSVAVHPDEIPNVWDLDCTIAMIPSYHAIVEQEQAMEKLAAKFNGYNDGWGIEA